MNSTSPNHIIIVAMVVMCLTCPQITFSASGCPTPSAINPKYQHLIPDNYTQFLAVQNHKCDAVLRLFAPKGCVRERWWCGDDDHKVTASIIFEDLKNDRAYGLGDPFVEESQRGGSGAIFIPLAFTKDDNNIILDSWMAEHGMGGGVDDYGYYLISLSDAMKSGLIRQKQFLVSSSSIFFDDYGKVIYVRNSETLPSFSQPGPESNDGMVRVKDLITMQDKLLLEETDTSYELIKVDEHSSRATIRSTKHIFTNECPRNREDSLNCSTKVNKYRIVNVE